MVRSGGGGLVWLLIAWGIYLVKIAKHLLILLLGIEFLTLVLIGGLRRRMGGMGGLIIFIFFTCRVCEARIGLAILVTLGRKWGKEEIEGIV